MLRVQSHNNVKRVGIFLIVAALTAGMAGCIEPIPPYDPEIHDWHDLHAVRYHLDKSYILMNDLDSGTCGYEALAGPAANEGRGWQPIAASIYPFSGTFDGQGYEIRDLFIDRPEQPGVGLFREIGEGGVIDNVGVVNATVTGRRHVGGLVGSIDLGTVSNSYFGGSVTGEGSVGGLVGTIDLGTVSNSHYDYDHVLINGENTITIGALFTEDFQQWLADDKYLNVDERLSQEDGYYLLNSLSDFEQLLAFGQDDSLRFRLKGDLALDTHSNFCIPYLAGEFDGNGHKVLNLSFSSGVVSHVGLFGFVASGGKVREVAVDNADVSGNEAVGGLVGLNHGEIRNCCATGSVAGESRVGGVAGSNEGTVSNSYSACNVTGDTRVGGAVGLNLGTVTNTYSSVSVTGESSVGGLVGWNFGAIRNSYATAGISGDTHVGGLVGSNWGTVSNSFWDKETSGIEESDGGTGKTIAEMQSIATFADTETEGLDQPWNIAAVAPDETNLAYIWNIVDDETYPFLSWESVS